MQSAKPSWAVVLPLWWSFIWRFLVSSIGLALVLVVFATATLGVGSAQEGETLGRGAFNAVFLPATVLALRGALGARRWRAPDEDGAPRGNRT